MITSEEYRNVDEAAALAKAARDFKAGNPVRRAQTLQELYPDPVELIEHLYGPKDNPKTYTSALGGFAKTWDERRLKIATNPEYIERCRESYAFADLLGREYNGVVFE